MGMYTEAIFKFELTSPPDNVRNVIEYLFGDREKVPGDLPDHDFFKCPRWEQVGSMSSFYHTPFALSQVWSPEWKHQDMYVFSRFDMKNYNNEIQKFLHWIAPYISSCEDVIGWYWYEESEEPSLLRLSQVLEGSQL